MVDILLKPLESFTGSDLPIFVNVSQVNRPIVPHGYEDFVMLSIIERGRGTHRTIHGDEQLTRGDVLLTRAGGWHAYHHCHKLVVRNLAVSLSLLRNELAWITREPELSDLIAAPVQTGESAIITRLTRPLLQRCAAHHDRVAWLLAESAPSRHIDILAEVLLLLGRIVSARSPHFVVRGRQADDRILNLMDHLEDRLDHDWSLNDLAAHVHLERSYFVRLFRSVAGLPPMQYLKQRRLSTAASLLLSTDLSVQEIGLKVNMLEPAVFSRAFRAHFGASPTEYRRQMRVRQHQNP